MRHERLVELTTILRRRGRLPVEEARELARGISYGNSALEVVTFRLFTQTHNADDAAQFSAACKLLFGPELSEWAQ